MPSVLERLLLRLLTTPLLLEPLGDTLCGRGLLGLDDGPPSLSRSKDGHKNITLMFYVYCGPWSSGYVKTIFGVWFENSLLVLLKWYSNFPDILSTLTAVVLAGRWGDVTNAGGELAFPLMWGVPGTITGTAAVARVLTASTGTMQAHLTLFGLHTRCSGLAAAFQDRRIRDIRLCFYGPVESCGEEQFRDLARY